jgi:hypothetical protein
MMPEAIARGVLIAASLRFAAISTPTSKNEITETMLH